MQQLSQCFKIHSAAAVRFAVLAQQPDHVSSLRFLNVEGQAEAGDLTNRFEQVTLFRTHQVGLQWMVRNFLELDTRLLLALRCKQVRSMDGKGAA